MKNFRKVLLFLGLGLFTASCTNAQEDGKSQTKEYSAQEIIKKINKGKPLLIANAIIKDDLSFAAIDEVEFATPGQFTANVDAVIYFQSCVFLGNVTATGTKEVGNKKVPVKSHFAKDVNFIDCDFRKNVDFSESDFDRSLNFHKSVFRGVTEFNNMLCNGKQNQWWEIAADSTFRMCGTIFRGDINMMDAKFSQGASFQNLVVENLQMSNMAAEGEFDFSNATVKGDALFNYINCQSDASFAFGRYDSRVDINGATFAGKCDMERSLFHGMVKLNRTKFEKGLHAEEAQFMLKPQTEETQCGEGTPLSFKKFGE